MNQRPAPETVSNAEPVYAVRLLPEVREAIVQYATEQRIPVSVAIAEACRAFVGAA